MYNFTFAEMYLSSWDFLNNKNINLDKQTNIQIRLIKKCLFIQTKDAGKRSGREMRRYMYNFKVMANPRLSSRSFIFRLRECGWTVARGRQTRP